MKTVFKLEGEGNKLPFAGDSERVEKFRLSLPTDFNVTKHENEICVEIESNKEEDEQCQSLVDRELDRYFFLTCEKINAKMVRKKKTLTCAIAWRILTDLNDDVRPQNWDNKLSLQLRLWSLADDSNDKLTEMLLLFQIIELSYPDTSDKEIYPKYSNATESPNPRTECKLIRHLIVHASDDIRDELKNYCTYLNMPEKMLNMAKTDVKFYEKIISKLPLMREEAKKLL